MHRPSRTDREVAGLMTASPADVTRLPVRTMRPSFRFRACHPAVVGASRGKRVLRSAASLLHVTATPRPVRIAGVLVGLQGVVAIAVGLLVAAARGRTGPVPILATGIWLAGFGAILLAVGANLVRGRHGARTPAIVAQLLLLGVCWYAAGPSSQPAYGVPAAAFCVAVLALLFCPPALLWTTGCDRG